MSKRGELTREHILATAKRLIMENGFAGTSVDDILKAAEVSKGAFFHHFKSRADLASKLLRWHAAQDITMFRTLAAEAEATHDDPYDQLTRFLTDFETYISNPTEPSRGCMYAVFTYESEVFDEDVTSLVADTLREWSAIYIRKFQEVIDRYPPRRPVSAKQLSEMIVSLIEGGLVLQRAFGNTQITARQSEHFRAYLDLLFADSREAA
ncbi:TetR/AcrR family transcriptional regulator [Tropicimonas marinistellae]|uniref:TetR/AcrR family transcriptional regulator n=1 Tax=Tropicimonas marinistellae TaxID=1739787 RepID=UPI00082B757C|nr:TetR/AcrR family transcriptional regulator [Tropicimonas marinistellae]